MYQIPVGDNMRIHLLGKYNVWQFNPFLWLHTPWARSSTVVSSIRASHSFLYLFFRQRFHYVLGEQIAKTRRDECNSRIEFYFSWSAEKLGRLEVKMEGTFGASTSSSSLSARLFDWLAKSRQSIKWRKPLFETFKLPLRCCLGVWFVGWVFQGCFTMVHTAYMDGHSGCRLHLAIHRVNKSTKIQSEYLSLIE